MLTCAARVLVGSVGDMETHLTPIARTVRLVRRLDALPVGTTVGLETLAAELGVTTRSVRRHIDKMRGVGEPIGVCDGLVWRESPA